MSLIYHKPIRKVDAFVCKVTKPDLKPVRMTIYFAKIVSLNPRLLKVWIPEDSSSKELLDQYDNSALDATIKNNTIWFNNGLEQEQIQSFFRRSVNNKDVVAILSSEVRPPIVLYNEEPLPDGIEIKDLPLSECHISLEIELQGLFFYSQKFGLRWLLRSIKIDKNDQDTPETIVNITKGDVEAHWKHDIEALNASIDNDIESYTTRIELLKAYRKEVNGLLSDAIEEKDASPRWNDCLAEMSCKVAKYYAGGLFYL